MKKFAFPLESVLRYKRQLERMAELREMQARAAVDLARRRVEDLREQLERVAESMAEAPRPPDSWPARFERTVRIGDALKIALESLEKAEQALREAAKERLRWSTEVESLKLLQQQQLEEHRHLEQRSEQVRLDEVGMQRWSQPRSGESDSR
jgi:flagellar FliJ protein